jgi:PAS domain S-box-containing protein
MAGSSAVPTIAGNEDLYRLLVEASPLPTWITDETTGRFLLVNTAALHAYGYTRDEFLAMSIDVLRKDGRLSDVELRSTRVSIGDVSAVVTHVLDQDHHQRRVEHALVESEQLHRELIENASDVITVIDQAGTMTYCSASVERLLGHSPSDIVGQQVVTFVHPDDHQIVLDSILHHRANPGVRHSSEIRFRHADGSWRRFEAVGAATVPNPGALRIVVNARDVTDRRDAEEHQRALARALAAAHQAAEAATVAKSEFLATMSHEIRTPLNAVLGLTEHLLDTTLSAEQRRHLQMVHDAGDVLLILVNDILDLSKIEADRIVLEAMPLALSWVAHGAVALFTPQAEARGLSLRVEIGPDVPGFVRGDPTRIRQVLTNLISNAVKFTEHGEIVVGVTTTAVSGTTAGVRVSVRDTGVGIPADKLDSLFTAFQQLDNSTTRTHGGSGLGLTISRRLVRLMGGELSVTSELGKGSDFSFSLTLPIEVRGARGAEASSGPTPTADAVAPAAAEQMAPLRILLAEDNPVNQQVALAILRKRGHHLTVVDDGQQALDAAALGGYDIILMDIHMPNLDGIAATAAIRQLSQGASVPIVAVTADASPAERERCLAAGMDDFLTKPYTAKALYSIAEATVARRRTT